MISATLLAPSAARAEGTEGEEVTVTFSEEQLREAVFAAIATSDLYPTPGAEETTPHVDSALALAEIELVDQIDENHPITEQTAEELETVFEEIHFEPASGEETEGASIEAFAALSRFVDSLHGKASSRKAARPSARPDGLGSILDPTVKEIKKGLRGLLSGRLAQLVPRKGSFDPSAFINQTRTPVQAGRAMEVAAGEAAANRNVAAVAQRILPAGAPKANTSLAALAQDASPNAQAQIAQIKDVRKAPIVALNEQNVKAMSKAESDAQAALKEGADVCTPKRPSASARPLGTNAASAPSGSCAQAQQDMQSAMQDLGAADEGANLDGDIGRDGGKASAALAQAAQQADAAVDDVAKSIGTTAADVGFDLASSLADPAMAIMLAAQGPQIIMSLVDLISGEPSSEQEILEQLQEIEKMIRSLSQQVHTEIGQVDQNLAAITLTLQEDTLLLNGIDAHVGALTNDMAQLEEKVNQLQADLWEIARTQREEALVADLDTDIGYSERTPGGSPMPLTQFEQAAGTFFAWGTFDPTDPVSELPPTNWAKAPSEIAEQLGSSTSTDGLDFNIDYLAAHANEWGDGLSFSPGLPNPVVWADGANAFAQLLVENPEYVTESMLSKVSRLEEVGAALPEELEKLTQTGEDPQEEQREDEELRGADRVPPETGSSVLNRALINYLKQGDGLLSRLEAEEHDFLSQQDPGKEGEPNCLTCRLAQAPNPAVANVGRPYIELWSREPENPHEELSEQEPSEYLTKLEAASSGTQPEEAGVRTPGQINACNTEAQEEVAFHTAGLPEPSVKQFKPGALELDSTLEWNGSEHASPLPDPLPNAFANAWHLGLGHMSLCYATREISQLFAETANLTVELNWNWYDNATAKPTTVLQLELKVPQSHYAPCQEGHIRAESENVYLQDLWTPATGESTECFELPEGLEQDFLGKHRVRLHFEERLALSLAQIEEIDRQLPAPQECTSGLQGEELEGWEACLRKPSAATYGAVRREVEEKLKSLRLETYQHIAPLEDPTLNAGEEDVHKAAQQLDGARALLDDYIELGMPRSIERDPLLGELVFGPKHLLDDSANSYELFQFFTQGIEETEATREEKSLPPPGDPAGGEGALAQRITAQTGELGTRLHEDIAAGSASRQVLQGDSLIPATLARLEVMQAVFSEEAPTIARQPSPTSVEEPASATFTAEADGEPTPEVQWEVSSDGGETFIADTTDAGNTENTLTVEGTSVLESGYEYRARFSNESGSVTSAPATLTVVRAPHVTKGPAPQSVVEPAPATFTAEATGTPEPTIQWEVSSNAGKSFSADTVDVGDTTETLKVEHTTVSENGYEYRARFTSSAGIARSEAATLTVKPAPAPAFTIAATQEIKGTTTGFTKEELTAKLGQTIDYQITVTNSGNVSLTLTNFSDASCLNVSGGPGVAELAPDESTVYTCERAISHNGSYLNEASVEGIPAVGEGFPLTHTSNQLVVLGPSPSPTVETGSASEVRQRTATVNATVNPHGGKTTSCKFEYGTSSLNLSAPCSTSPGSSSTPVPVSAELKGLAASTTYRFRISAASTSGTATGAQATFKTMAAAAPTVETKSASEVGQRGALVSASVDPNGGEVTRCTFEYGTTALNLSVPCSKLPGAGTSAVTVSAQLKGLTPNTTYHFRISATSLSGSSKGGEEALRTTLAFAPTVETKGATEVGLSAAVLNAAVNPNGGEVTVCKFEYGTSSLNLSAPCSKLPGSGIAAVPVTAQLKGLAANTTYHFRISASSASGTSKGTEETFKT